MIPSAMIPLLVTGNSVLVFDLAHVKYLREAGIVGVLVGSLPKAPQQNVFLGLPLQLSAYEAVWLVEAGIGVLVDAVEYNRWLERPEPAVVTLSGSVQYAITRDTHRPEVSPEGPSSIEHCKIEVKDFLQTQHNARFSANYRAFKYLRDRDYFLMPGLRFGGVFVAYPGDPLRYHSHLIVKALERHEPVDLLQIVSSGRLATAVKKVWLLISETDGQETESKESESEESESKLSESKLSESKLSESKLSESKLSESQLSESQSSESQSSEETKLSEVKASNIKAFSIEWAGFG